MDAKNHNVPDTPAANTLSFEPTIPPSLMNNFTDAASLAQNVSTAPKNTVTIYGCGGAGINLANLLQTKLSQIDTDTLANFKIALFDTSKANFVNGVVGENTYFMGSEQGSGMDRSANANEIRACMPAAITKFPAGDFSIILTSLSGGSGSTISPVLLGNLVRAGKKVVVIAVSSADSAKAIDNTLMVLANFEKLAASTGVPTIMSVFHNEHGERESDEAAVATTLLLGALMSGINERLDTADLNNFFNYTKVSKAPVKMMGLITDTLDNKVATSNDYLTVTVATLAQKGAATRTPWLNDYQTVGFYPSFAQNQDTVHFMIVDGCIQQLYDKLHTDLAGHTAQAKTRTYAPAMGGMHAGDLDDDLML